MPTVSRKNLLVGLAAASVLGAGLALPSLAFAGDSTPSASPSTGASASASADADGGDPARRESAFAAALAKELGLPTERVQAAMEKVRGQHRPARPDGTDRADRRTALKERLAQAVKEGRLTQEQADAINAAVEAGVFPGGWRGHHGHGGRDN